MNDFTKEELVIIYCNLCVNTKTKDILIKLQSMIDMYCEHEWKHCYDKSEYDECEKCGLCEL
jgi:hypothetical protein